MFNQQILPFPRISYDLNTFQDFAKFSISLGFQKNKNSQLPYLEVLVKFNSILFNGLKMFLIVLVVLIGEILGIVRS